MGQLSYTWVLCASANIPGLPVYCNRAPLVLHPTYAESCNHPHPHDPMAPRHICWSLPAIPMLLSTFVICRTFCTDYRYPRTHRPTRRYRLQVSIGIPIYLSIFLTRTDGPPHLSRTQLLMGPAISIDVNIPSAHLSPSATFISTTNASMSIQTLY